MKKLAKFIDVFLDDEIMTRAAALSFYTSVAIAPLAVLIVVVLSTIGVDLQVELIREVSSVIGNDAGDLLKTIINGANERPDLKSVSGIAGVVGLLVSASIIFVQLQTTLNFIFDVQSPGVDQTKRQMLYEFILARLVSVGMLLGFIFILIVSLIVSTGLSLLSWGDASFLIEAAAFLFSLLVYTILFSLIFKWMPDRKITYHSAIFGGALTAVLFSIGKMLIGLYLANSAVGSAYGAAGSLIVLLIWVYYSSIVVFVGAEVSFLTLVKAETKKA